MAASGWFQLSCVHWTSSSTAGRERHLVCEVTSAPVMLASVRRFDSGLASPGHPNDSPRRYIHCHNGADDGVVTDCDAFQ